MSAPPTLQPLTFTPCSAMCSQNRCAVASSAFSVTTADSGMTSPPKSWPAEGQLQVLDPRLADALDGGPDPRGAIAVAEAAQDAFHGSTPIPILEG